MGTPPPRRSAPSGRGGRAVGLLGLLRPVSGDVFVMAWFDVVLFLEGKRDEAVMKIIGSFRSFRTLTDPLPYPIGEGY